MTKKQFFDWQTNGGTNEVMRLIQALESADIHWCAIGGVAVNHWALEPMVTADVDFVVGPSDIDSAEAALVKAGFASQKFPWSINFQGQSAVSLQLSTEDFYLDFPSRGVPADVHGILMRVACLADTMAGKIRAWSDASRRQSKRMKDLADIARLTESHPELWRTLPEKLQSLVEQPQ